MGLAIFLFVGGAVICVWIYLWQRQRQQLVQESAAEALVLDELPTASSDDAIIISRDHGQLVYVNARARNWLDLNGTTPNLELIAQFAQPADSFLGLFSKEYHSSFQLGSRWVEASSHRVPEEKGMRTVVVMRELGTATASPNTLNLAEAMKLINRIGETVNASQGVEPVLQGLLTVVNHAIGADAGEICLWDETLQVLEPRGWLGDAAYVLRLAEVGGVYRVGEGISGWIARYREPVLSVDPESQSGVMPKLADNGYSSFVGVPLEIGDRFVGTFELAAEAPGAFDQKDLALLQAISIQIATAIHNAELYTAQLQHIDNLTGLQDAMDQTRGKDYAHAVYAALSERLAGLIGADMCGILLYDDHKQALLPQIPFYGIPDQITRQYSMPMPPGGAQRRIWENQPYWISNDIADDPMAEELGMTALIRSAGVYNTALVPLDVGQRRTGLIQFANKQHDGGFTLRDIQTLRVLAAQAAAVVENTRLYEREQARDTELEGLQEITHAISAFSNEADLFEEITNRIARLMEIESCGILLYEQDNARLVAHLPFYGIANEDVADYTIPLQVGTSIEAIWQQEDTWYTNAAAAERVIIEANLDPLIARLGIRQMMLAPLSIGERRLGMLQVANQRSEDLFDDDDLRLLSIFATQAAAIIDNARLYRDLETRVQQSDSLRRIAEMAGSILTPDEPLTPVLAEIAYITESPIVFINVLSELQDSLITYPRYIYGIELDEPVIQEVHRSGRGLQVAITRRSYRSEDLEQDGDMYMRYQRLTAQVGIGPVLIVPLVIGDRVLGEMGIANRPDRIYDDNDESTLWTIASQVAGTLDRVSLYQSAGQNLNRRMQELDAISHVSNELTLTLDLDHILGVILEEARKATEANSGVVALLKATGQWDDEGNPEMILDRRIGSDDWPDLAPIEREAIRHGGNAVPIDNYSESDLEAMPAEAEAALAVAFLYENQVVGVIHLYHDAPHGFDERAIEFVRTLAAKATLGYGNARRYDDQINRNAQLRRRVEQLNQIFELGQILQSNTDPPSMLEAIAYSVTASAGYDVAVMMLLDEDSAVLRRVAQAGLPLDTFDESKDKVLTLDALAVLQDPEFRISESYFFPVEKREKWANEEREAALSTAFEGQRAFEPASKEDWHSGDLLIVPLNTPAGERVGLMVLDGPQDQRRPNRFTIELLEIFAHQASTNIENSRLYLRSMHSAEEQARLNEIMAAITSRLDITTILEGLARGAQRMVPFMRMTVALQNTERHVFDIIRLDVKADGSLATEQEVWSSLDQTALGRSYADGQSYLYHHGDSEVSGFDDVSAWQESGERTTLILPLMVGGERLGAMHLGSDLLDAYGFEEFREFIERLANLSAVAIQNTHLLDHAVNLRQFNESIVESIQQGIVVLDKSGRIISLNDFMTERYHWDKSAIGRDLFEYQPDMRKMLFKNVQRTLEDGEPQELITHSLQVGDSTLVCNFYIYPLGDRDNMRGIVLLVEDLTERAQLEQDVEARASQLAALTEVSSRITASLDHSEVVALALSAMGQIISYDTLTFWLREGDFLYLRGAKDYEDETMPLETRVRILSHERLRKVVESKQVYSISRLQGWDTLPGERGAQSWMGVPLVSQGNVIGVIALCKQESSAYDDQAEQAAFAFANQVAVALANADLFREAERRTQRLSLLNRVSVSLGQSLDSEDILEIALREISQVLHLDHAFGLMYERDLQLGRVVVEHPRGDHPPDEIINLDASATYEYIRREVKSIVIEDVKSHEDPELEAVLIELAPRLATTYILIPMAIGGQVIGAFELLGYDSPTRLDPEQTDLGRIIANQAAIAIQNTSLLEQTLVRSRELETLLEAAQATSLTLDLHEVYSSVVDLMMHALDMDDCALMTWDDVDRSVEVQVDVNRAGDPNRISPPGTRYNLSDFPSKLYALEHRQVIVLSSESPELSEHERRELEAFGDIAQVLVPLVVRDVSVGLVQLELEAEYRTFTHREIRLAQALGSQAATAIENARLSTETANRVEELYIINDLSQAISATISIDRMTEIVRNRVPDVLGVEEMYLALYDHDRQEITFPLYVRGGEHREMPPRQLNDDEVSFIIRNRRPLSMGSDYFGPDELRRSLGISNAEGDVKSYLGVPLISGDEVIGVMAVRDSKRTRAFGVNSQGIMTTIASQLGAAIQNAVLFNKLSSVNEELSSLNRNLEGLVADRTEELSDERDRIDTLYRITAELARTLDLERVLKSALQMVAGAVNAEDGVIMQIDPTTDQLHVRAALAPEWDSEEVRKSFLHPAAELAQSMIDSGGGERTMVVPDLRQNKYWDPRVEEYQGALAVLLEINDDILGVMILLAEDASVFNDDHVRLALASANQVAAAINNSDLYYLIRDQAERLGVLVLAEQQEAQRGNTILEGIADGVMLSDANHEVVRFNSAAERILGLSGDMVLGQPWSRIASLQNPAWTAAVDDWAHSAENDPAEGFLSEQVEIAMRVVNVRLSPVRTDDEYLGTVFVFRDVTKETEADRVKSEFISNVSHELRTPMTSIKGYADLLSAGAVGPLTDQQREFMSKIKGNAERLSILVDDLLNISVQDSGKEQLSISNVSLGTLLDTVVNNVQSRAGHENKDMLVHLEVAADLPDIAGDPNKLTQIFTNIVDNAFNYTYAGGSIDIAAVAQDGGTVLVSVKDSGIGIPDDFKDRVWERFGRYEEHALVMDVPGTGLGLPIVKSLVEMHKGEIWFESESGVGTTFYVRLPIEQRLG